MSSWGIQAGQWWPLALGLALVVLAVLLWLRRQGALFPDVRLLSATAPAGGVLDRLPLVGGAVLIALLLLSLMDVSTVRTVVAERQARDFLVIVDVSRSMRHNTALLREDFPPTYERRASLFTDRGGMFAEVEDPSTIPELARYEIARESLLQFLASRRADDRIALSYFESKVTLMSGFTSNFDFIERQLADMDPYVIGGTDIRLALESGLDLMARYPSQNRRAVLLLTDAEAEARHFDGLLRQLDRLGRYNAAFYLLWITTDVEGELSEPAREFLRHSRNIGSVFTIDDVSEGHLEEALAEIGALEDYTYAEVRHERVDWSRYVFLAACWWLLPWVLLLGTVYHPLRENDIVSVNPPR